MLGDLLCRQPLGRSEARRLLQNAFASFAYLEEQPFLLGYRLRFHDEERRALSEIDGGSELLAALERTSGLGLLLMAFLRSALPGYPELLVPHVEETSAWACEGPLVRRFSWARAFMAGGFSTAEEFVAAVVRFSSDGVAEPLDRLRGAVVEHRDFARFFELRAGFSGAEVDTLREVCQQYREATSDDRVESKAGPLVYRAQQVREHELRNTCARSPAFARRFYDSFVGVDRLLENVMLLVAEISIRGREDPVPPMKEVSWSTDSRELHVVHELAIPWPRIGSLMSVSFEPFDLDGVALVRGRGFSMTEQTLRLELLEDSSALRRALAAEPG